MAFPSRLGSFASTAPLAVLLIGLASPTPVLARDLTAAETTALGSAVGSFNTAMGASDFKSIVEVIPPRLVTQMAQSVNVSPEALRTAIIAQMAKTLEAVKIDSSSMDVQHLEMHELKDGTPYALIPTSTVMVASGSKVDAESRTLALLDDGQWYLVRISEPQQVALLKQAYPAFADVTFEPGTLKAVAP